MKSRPVASLSLDLDNQWSYMKTHGDDGWQSYPGYLEVVVPRFLEFLDQRGTKITVFVVGKDAENPANKTVLRSIADAGHEIGNHSYHHEPWLHLYTDDQLVAEFEKSESAIMEATSQRPRGFRGPGFSFSDHVLTVLAERGYVYDGSTFPTFLGPLARAWYFFSSRLSRQQREERKQLFGKLTEGFRPNKPYVWNIGNRRLLEIPVTTMPLFKVPIHISYICFLATWSGRLARFYFWLAMQMCRLTGTRPSLLLHPLDFMDVDDVPELAFFPAMQMPWVEKVKLLNDCLDMMDRYWECGTMHHHAEAALHGKPAQRHVRISPLVTSQAGHS